MVHVQLLLLSSLCTNCILLYARKHETVDAKKNNFEWMRNSVAAHMLNKQAKNTVNLCAHFNHLSPKLNQTHAKTKRDKRCKIQGYTHQLDFKTSMPIWERNRRNANVIVVNIDCCNLPTSNIMLRPCEFNWRRSSNRHITNEMICVMQAMVKSK